MGAKTTSTTFVLQKYYTICKLMSADVSTLGTVVYRKHYLDVSIRQTLVHLEGFLLHPYRRHTDRSSESRVNDVGLVWIEVCRSDTLSPAAYLPRHSIQIQVLAGWQPK